jgi:GT2 family glycosyltransferase
VVGNRVGAMSPGGFRVVALILTWNGGEMTHSAAASVNNEVDEVIVIDNASAPSEQESLSAWCRQANVTLIQNQSNLGYAAGNNVGIAYALERAFDGILIMNNDATAEPGAVRTLVDRVATAPLLGAVSPMVVDMANPNTVIHTACDLRVNRGNVEWRDHGRSRVDIAGDILSTDVLSGEAFLARSAALRQCGGFDERFVYYFEDTEWSTRVRRSGWELEVVPRAVFRHMVSGSMPSARAVYFRARNRPIYLRVGLEESHLSAARKSARTTAVMVAGLLKRRQLRLAARATRGWLVGLLSRDRQTR